MHVRDLGLSDLGVVMVVAALLIWGGKLRNLFRPGPPSTTFSTPIPSSSQ